MRNLIYILIFSTLLFACNGKSKVIAIPKMKFIMWDIVNADEWMKLAVAKDSSITIKKENIALYNKIFTLHKITKDEFYNSYNYYETHPNEMKILLDSIAAFGIRKRDTLTNHLK